jgi:histidinol-phosphate aminotransferase
MKKGYVPPQEQYKGGIRLDTNEAPYSLTIALPNIGDLNRYRDDTYDKLRQALAAQFSCHEEEIFIGSGSSQILDVAMGVFGRKGVITSDPSYRQYRHLAENRGLSFTAVPSQSDLTIDTDAYTQQTADQKLAIICNPNNPDGHYVPLSELHEIVSKSNGTLLIDEAYIDFAGPEARSSAMLDPEHVMTVQTFSKSYGAAALRLAYALSDKTNIRQLQAAAPLYPTGKLEHIVGLQLLAQQTIMRQKVIEVVQMRDQVATNLTALGCTVFPSSGNFLLFKPPHHFSATAVHRSLVAQGIIVRDMSDQDRVADCLRVTIGTSKENMVFLKTLQNILSHHATS